MKSRSKLISENESIESRNRLLHKKTRALKRNNQCYLNVIREHAEMIDKLQTERDKAQLSDYDTQSKISEMKNLMVQLKEERSKVTVLQSEVEDHIGEIEELRAVLARRSKNLQVAQKRQAVFEKLNHTLRIKSSKLENDNSRLKKNEESLKLERNTLLEEKKKILAEVNEVKAQLEKEKTTARIARVKSVKSMNMLTAADHNIKALRLDVYNRAKENISVRARLASISKANDLESDKLHELLSLRERNKSLEKITESEDLLKQAVRNLEEENEAGLDKQSKFQNECKELRDQISRLMCDQKISAGYLEQAMQTAIEKRILEQKSRELQKVCSEKNRIIDELTDDLKLRTKEIASYESRLREQEAKLIEVISQNNVGKNEFEEYLQESRNECEMLQKQRALTVKKLVVAQRKLNAANIEMGLEKKSCAHYQELLKLERETNSENFAQINRKYHYEIDQLDEKLENDRLANEKMQDDFQRVTSSCVLILKVLLAAESSSKKSFICPQCKVLFRDPVTCQPCGHSFCDNCIQEHCPLCHERVSYYPNDILLALTNSFKERFDKLTELNHILEKKEP